MSVREAKGRMLSREYMADRQWMTSFTPDEREWYMLTALFADDAGFLLWDLPDNAANVYRYEVPSEREARVTGYIARFAESGRFGDLGCGHASMPRVGKRPRGHKREYAVRDAHSACTRTALQEHSQSTGSALASVPIQSNPFLSCPALDGPAAAGAEPSSGTHEAGEFGAAMERHGYAPTARRNGTTGE
jgi:hypothetical protein